MEQHFIRPGSKIPLPGHLKLFFRQFSSILPICSGDFSSRTEPAFGDRGDKLTVDDWLASFLVYSDRSKYPSLQYYSEQLTGQVSQQRILTMMVGALVLLLNKAIFLRKQYGACNAFEQEINQRKERFLYGGGRPAKREEFDAVFAHERGEVDRLHEMCSSKYTLTGSTEADKLLILLVGLLCTVLLDRLSMAGGFSQTIVMLGVLMTLVNIVSLEPTIDMPFDYRPQEALHPSY
jgi:hypothetical protein